MTAGKEWAGRVVMTRPDSGWGHGGDPGVALPMPELSESETGWFLFDSPKWAQMFGRTPMLAHTQEFYSPDETAGMIRFGLSVVR